MHSQRGHGGFPATFLIFSLLVLVLAGGFAVGRLVIGRAYLRSAGQFEKWPTPRAEPATPAPEARGLPSGQGYVPEPAEEPGRAEPGAPASPAREPAGDEPPAAGAPAVPSEASPPAAELPKEPEGKEKRFAIQVGLFEAEEGAQEVAAELARAGYPARVEAAGSDAGTIYRVVTGRYRTEYAARKALDQLRQEGFPGFLVER